MAHRKTSPNSRRFALPAAVAAGVLLLAACGEAGDEIAQAEDEFAELMDEMEEMEEAAGELPDDAAATDDPTAIEVIPPEFHLPEPTDPPDGYSRIAAACENEGDGAWVTYAVPEDWERTSRSGGGSGTPLSTSVELGFDLPDGGRVTVELDTESRRPDGTILDSSGQPFESFDYDYSVGDDTVHVTYDQMETVTVGDQQVDIWVAPRDQAPDLLSTTEHKARFEAASLPNPAPGDDDGQMPASFVLSVQHDPESVELDEEVVTTLVETLAFPTCTIEEMLVQQELRFGEDFNGDGEVTTVEDLLDD